MHQTKTYIIHENDAWVEPLRAAFNRIGAPFEEWFIHERCLDLSATPPPGIFYNRMSASSHTRGHRYAAELTGGILAWRLPEDVPVWAGALILLIGYQIVVSPIRAAQHWSWNLPGPGQPGLYAFWNAAIWLTGMAVVVWIATHHIPEIQEFIHRLPGLTRDFAEATRDLFTRQR